MIPGIGGNFAGGKGNKFAGDATATGGSGNTSNFGDVNIGGNPKLDKAHFYFSAVLVAVAAFGLGSLFFTKK